MSNENTLKGAGSAEGLEQKSSVAFSCAGRTTQIGEGILPTPENVTTPAADVLTAPESISSYKAETLPEATNMPESANTLKSASDTTGTETLTDELTDERVKDIQKLLRRMDTNGLYDYVRLSQNTPKILWFNFISGIARGLGFSIGTTVVLAIIYKVVTKLLSMVNIPYLAEFLADFLEMVNKNLQ
ncbi:DUF5665 domain-containing protein [Desulfovibrio sp. OttesenSCG-928-F07]|nr:DUF5665 domain-containing protein [Desulfovibrio sp. OttesenSCG-928-F07]